MVYCTWMYLSKLCLSLWFLPVGFVGLNGRFLVPAHFRQCLCQWTDSYLLKHEQVRHYSNMSNMNLQTTKILKAISVLMLCVPVFIFTCTSSSALSGHSTLWFINLTVATCHIQHTFLSLCQYFFHEKIHRTRKYSVCHFHMIRKWPQTVIRCAKH